MFRHILIAAAGSLLIAGGSLFALTMASANPPTATTQPASRDGLPVTDLPGMTVYPAPPAQPASHPRRRGNRTATADHPLMNNLIQAAATQAVGSQLRMPYYSFGSASGTTRVQTRKD